MNKAERDRRESGMVELKKEDLVPGMILGEDVYNFAGQLVIPQGTRLTDYMIGKLEFYSILKVEIESGSLVEPVIPQETTANIEKNHRIEIFQKEYEQEVEVFKNSLNEIVEKNADIDIDNLYQNVMQLLDEGHNFNMFNMIQTLREYDDSTYAHAINVSLICNMLAKWLDFSEEDVRIATICGLLHDIGKLKVPSEIIKKPAGLTNEEYDVIKHHPIDGYDILKDRPIDRHIKYAALMHHEKCDGTGYPCGLVSGQIDPFAKLVAIADIYDAMTAKRVYRGPMCPFEVIRIFEDEGLARYDVTYILTFLQRVADTYMHEKVRLSDGREGEIIFINKQRISRPTVICDGAIVDLSKVDNLKIEHIL